MTNGSGGDAPTPSRRWKFEKTYTIEAGPPPMGWDEYSARVLAEWRALIAIDAAVHVERQRETSQGTPDKWRKP